MPEQREAEVSAPRPLDEKEHVAQGTLEHASGRRRRTGRNRRARTIRTRLLITCVAAVLGAAAAVSATSAVMGIQSGQQKAFEQLELVAAFKEAEIDNWVDSLLSGLSDALTQADAILFARVLLEQEPTLRGVDIRSDLEERILRYVERTGKFERLFLLDLEGRTVASTDATQADEIHQGRLYLQEGQKGDHTSFYSPSSDRTVLVAAQPVLSKDGRTIGVFVGCADTEALDEIMRERVWMGETVKAYVIGHDRAQLSEPHLQGVYTEGVNAVLERQENGVGSYKDQRGESVVGVYHWLPGLQVALLAEQDWSEAFRSVYVTLAINVAVALVSSVLAAVGAWWFVTGGVVNPLAELAETSTQIAAGDLERAARVGRRDEIGTLAEAFNSMTVRLREMLHKEEERATELEREIAERKQAEAEREQLQQEVIETQRRTLLELSAPLMPITDEVLVLPLVGTIDSQRAEQIIGVLLEGVASQRARVIILDITGVPVVDTVTAKYLLQATQALRLVGAECVLVGITPEVAQTVVGLGVDLGSLVTRSDLQSGVEYALRRLGRRAYES